MNWNRNRENDEDKTPEEGQRPFRFGGNLIWLFLLAIGIFWACNLFTGGFGQQEPRISYTTFREHVEAGEVEQITMTGERIEGMLRSAATTEVEDGAGGRTVTYTDFVTYLPAFGDEELFALLRQQKVEVFTEPESEFSWMALLLTALPFLLLVGIGFMLFQRMQSAGQGAMAMGKSRARLFDRSKERTTFEDVAGAEGAKIELLEVVEFLKSPGRFQRLGGAIPKGVLLVGSPGTGKTLLARAVAGEAGVPFFSITGSDFMEMFVGVGASRVRDMFSEAKKSSPSIIFIDELDSIGRRRGAGLGGGHDEREQTLNQMLSELDGFEPNENVIVMAATNRPDILDPALLRPGRFDRRITVDLPTLADRVQILKIHARNKPLAEDVDLQNIARGTPGFSGADLENILNEAALLAARKGKDVIELEDLDGARDKVLMGLERHSLVMTDEERRLLAYHEAGHAVVAAVVPNADPIHKVTIVPRGQAMGVTQQLPRRDRYLYPREYMVDRLAVIMGGRAAEELVMDTSTSGAENDLKQAAQLARKMVLDWGMSERLKHIALGTEREEVFLGEEIAQRREFSEDTAREIDQEIKDLLNEVYELAKQILSDHREGLDRVVEALLDKEEIPGKKVIELLGLERRDGNREEVVEC